MKTLTPVMSLGQYHDLVYYDTVGEYRWHFEEEYCCAPLVTFDAIAVAFAPSDFNHAFWEGNFKDTFSWRRAERIDWIGKALRDPGASLHPGYDKSTDSYGDNRRVCLVGGMYVVVIEFVACDQAFFKTAYPASSHTASMVKRSPRW